jgi:uncharacterized protein YbjT (DUF2867 family)
MKIKAVLTGATGMVGEGVLQQCLQHPDVEEVVALGRRPSGISHPKLREVICPDLFKLASVENELTGCNACFFCLGVSSVGMKEEKYNRLTYELTLSVAQVLVRLNPEMTFCYVSGKGTDSSEKGKSMWARVKGKTENSLRQLPFRAAYMFRPGYIQPGRGLKNTHAILVPLSWLYPLWRRLLPAYVCTLSELARAMIGAALHGYDKEVLEVPDIIVSARDTAL